MTFIGKQFASFGTHFKMSNIFLLSTSKLKIYLSKLFSSIYSEAVSNGIRRFLGFRASRISTMRQVLLFNKVSGNFIWIQLNTFRTTKIHLLIHIELLFYKKLNLTRFFLQFLSATMKSLSKKYFVSSRNLIYSILSLFADCLYFSKNLRIFILKIKFK